MPPETDLTIDIIDETLLDLELAEEQVIEMELVETGPKGDDGASEAINVSFDPSTTGPATGGQVNQTNVQAVIDALVVAFGAQLEQLIGYMAVLYFRFQTAYTTYVYDPDAEGTENNVYSNFADLVSDMQGKGGRKYIQFVGSCVLPAGDFDMGFVTWLGDGNPFYTGLGYTITIPDGFTISNLVGFEVGKGLLVQNTSTEPVHVMPSGINLAIKYFEGATILNMNEVFIEKGVGTLTIDAWEGAVANPAPFFGSGAPFVRQTAGETQVIFGGKGSMLFNDIIEGTGSLVIIQQGDLNFGQEAFGGEGSMPALQNLKITNADFSGTTGRFPVMDATKLAIRPIEDMDAEQVQQALEELREAGGANDLASVGYDLSDKIASLSGYWTGNIWAKAFLTRTGRMVDGFISFVGLADAVPPEEVPELPLTTFMIRGEDLPFQPRNFGNLSEEVEFPLTEPGGFGILQNQIASSAIGSAASNFGGLLGDIPALIFFNVGKEGEAGLSTVVSNGNPLDFIGEQWNAFIRVRYEAAFGEGEEPGAISVDGAFPDGVVGEAYDEFINILGETEDLYITDIEITGDGLPDGLSLELVDHTLRLYGTPTTNDAFSFTVIMENNLGNFYYPIIFNVEITEPVAEYNIDLSGFTIPQFHVGHQTSQLYTIGLEDNSQNPLLQVEVISGSLPNKCGLYITSSNHKIQFNGKPDTVGTYNFRIRVTDALGNTAEKDMVCEVDDIGAPATNPESDPLYLGTWSPNSHAINFVGGGPQQYAPPGAGTPEYVASDGDILKVRSANAYITMGGSYYWVNIGDYIRFQGGLWGYYNYS